MAYFRSRSPIRNARTSLQQHQARLSLVAELPSPQSEAPKRQSMLREDHSPTGQAITTRSNSDAAMYAPVRRRSLLAHGVATRTSYVEPELPRSVPSRTDSAHDMQNYYYNPSKPTSSPLSDLAMLAPNPDFAIPGPRAETPTELHYGHLGGFKMGTLRITNGAASPVPSSHGRSNSLGAEEDNFEARKSVESGHRHGLSQRSNTIAVPADAIKAPWIVRAESPLRNSHDARFEPLTIKTQMPQDPSFATSNFEEERKLFKRTESPTKAQELANEYMQDLALSPFSFDNSPPLSPNFQVTSKHTAIEDDLFEAEPDSPRRSADLEIHVPRSFDSEYVGGEPSPPAETAKESRESAPKPLAKADSGYSSNVSLRSFKKDSSPAKEPTLRPPKEAVSRVASSTYSVESEATLRTRESIPAFPVEQIPEPPYRQPPPVPVKEKSFEIERAPRNVQPPPVPQMMVDQAYPAPPQSYAAASSSQNRPQQNTLPVPGTFVREGSPANSDLSVSSNSSSRWRPKITKRESQQSAHRIQTEQVFTVQAIRSPSEEYQIPPPSLEARRRLGEHEDAFPVQCFPNTVEGTVALRRMSIETLGTIFSVGSMEVSDELNFARLQGDVPPMPPMPTIIQEPAQKSRPNANRRNTYQAPAQYPPQPARQGRQGRKSFSPVSRERGPSPGQMANWGRQFMHSMPRDRVPRQVRDFEPHITSFETASSSHGRGAYDVARPSPVDQRAKSMTAQFEADAAARFALSKQRNVSVETKASAASTVMRPRKSYDSIANGNPYASGSGTSTANNSRSNSGEYQSILRRKSYSNLNLPTQSSLFAAPPSIPSPIEKRKSTKSPPPVTMRTQSISRKPVPQLAQNQPIRQPPLPVSQVQPIRTSAPPRKTSPSPLAQQHSSTWGSQNQTHTHDRRKSQASLSTRKSFDSTRRPATYEVLSLEEYKKREAKRTSSVGGPSPRHSMGDLTSQSPSKEKEKGKEAKKVKGKKSKEELKKNKGKEIDEIPRIIYHQPTLRSEDANGNGKGKSPLRERKSQEIPRIAVHGYAAEPLPNLSLGGRPKVRQSQSQEALTLRDLQREEELQARRPKSVQPSRAEQKQIREVSVEKEKQLEKVKAKGRWDAYTNIFGSSKKVNAKEMKISRPVPVERGEYDSTYGSTAVPHPQQENEYYAPASYERDQQWRPEQMRRVSSSTKDMLALHYGGGVRVQG
jgi:hypothetical protein